MTPVTAGWARTVVTVELVGSIILVNWVRVVTRRSEWRREKGALRLTVRDLVAVDMLLIIQ